MNNHSRVMKQHNNYLFGVPKISSFQYTGPPSSAPLLHTPVTINSTAVSLSWDEVNCTDHNGVITGYIVQYTITGRMTVTVNINATTSVVIAGLIKFRIYSFSVAAINDNGIGPYSNEHKIYTGLLNIIVLNKDEWLHFSS